jgi:hypothetical protein
MLEPKVNILILFSQPFTYLAAFMRVDLLMTDSQKSLGAQHQQVGGGNHPSYHIAQAVIQTQTVALKRLTVIGGKNATGRIPNLTPEDGSADVAHRFHVPPGNQNGHFQAASWYSLSPRLLGSFSSLSWLERWV